MPCCAVVFWLVSAGVSLDALLLNGLGGYFANSLMGSIHYMVGSQLFVR